MSHRSPCLHANVAITAAAIPWSEVPTLNRVPMPKRPALLLVAASLIALGLSGCSFSANLTVSASKVAETAADALEEKVGSRPDVDCGKEDVALVDGTIVECLVTDPATALEYDAPVTISDVSGTTFRVSVDVAQTANNPAEPKNDPAESDGDDATVGTLGADGTLSVYDYELAALAADALTESYGARPTVICREDPAQFAIEVGTAIECELIEAKTGARGIATITVTSIDGAAFNIDVKVVDA